MKSRFLTIIAITLLSLTLFSCHKIPVGYLNAENATYVPNVLTFYHEADPTSEWGKDVTVPWSSTRIQGISGTNPINFEFVGVKATDGGDVGKFQEMVRGGHLNVRGGLVQISQEGVRMLPLGSYAITLKVFNEGYSKTLEDILTIRVEAKQVMEDPYY